MWTFGRIIHVYGFWHLDSVLDLLISAKWKTLVWHVRIRFFMKTDTNLVYYITWANFRKFYDILFSIKKEIAKILQSGTFGFQLSDFNRTRFTLNQKRKLHAVSILRDYFPSEKCHCHRLSKLLTQVTIGVYLHSVLFRTIYYYQVAFCVMKPWTQTTRTSLLWGSTIWRHNIRVRLDVRWIALLRHAGGFKALPLIATHQ
jgi:hypothetical protein